MIDKRSEEEKQEFDRARYYLDAFIETLEASHIQLLCDEESIMKYVDIFMGIEDESMRSSNGIILTAEEHAALHKTEEEE